MMHAQRAPLLQIARAGERRSAPRWRLCWRRLAVLAFLVGFWSLVGWAIATVVGGTP